MTSCSRSNTELQKCCECCRTKAAPLNSYSRLSAPLNTAHVVDGHLSFLHRRVASEAGRLRLQLQTRFSFLFQLNAEARPSISLTHHSYANQDARSFSFVNNVRQHRLCKCDTPSVSITAACLQYGTSKQRAKRSVYIKRSQNADGKGEIFSLFSMTKVITRISSMARLHLFLHHSSAPTLFARQSRNRRSRTR